MMGFLRVYDSHNWNYICALKNGGTMNICSEWAAAASNRRHSERVIRVAADSLQPVRAHHLGATSE